MLYFDTKKGAGYGDVIDTIITGGSKSIHRINEEKTIANIDGQTIEAGTLLTDIIEEEKDPHKIAQNNSDFMQKIPEKFSIFNADVQPTLVESHFQLEDKEYAGIVSLLQNGYEAKFIKLYEKTPTGNQNSYESPIYNYTEQNLNSFVEKSQLTSKISNFFNDIASLYRKDTSNPDFQLPMATFVDKTKGVDVIDVSNGKTRVKVGKYTKFLAEAVLATIPTIKDEKVRENNKELFDLLKKMCDENGKIKSVYSALFSADALINNQEIDGIKNAKNAIAAYEIGVVAPNSKSSSLFKYNALSLAQKNTFEIFKNANISEETKKDINTWAKKAQAKDEAGLFHAYHLGKQIFFSNFEYFKNADANGILTPSDREKVLDNIKPLAEFYANIGFAGKALYERLSANEALDIKSVKGFVDDFRAKVATAVQNHNLAEQIKLTQDSTSIAHDSTDGALYYRGALPKGSAVTEFAKELKISGTTGSDPKKDIVAKVIIEPTSIFWTPKPMDNGINTRPSVTAPNINKNTDALLKEVITAIKISNNNGKYSFPNSSREYNLNIAAKIDSLVDKLNSEKDYKALEKKGTYLAGIVAFLNKHKDNIEELKKFIKDVSESDEHFKIGNTKFSSQPIKAILANWDSYDAATNKISSRRDSIRFNATRYENKIIESAGANEFFKKSDYPPQREFAAEIDNRNIGYLYDTTKAIASFSQKEKARVEAEKATNPYPKNSLYIGQEIRNPGLRNSWFSFTNDKGEEEKGHLNPLSLLTFHTINVAEYSQRINFDNGSYRDIMLPSKAAESFVNNIIQSPENQEIMNLIQDFRKIRGEELQSKMGRKGITTEAADLFAKLTSESLANDKQNAIETMTTVASNTIAETPASEESKITYVNTTESVEAISAETSSQIAVINDETPQQWDFGSSPAEDYSLFSEDDFKPEHFANKEDEQNMIEENIDDFIALDNDEDTSGIKPN